MGTPIFGGLPQKTTGAITIKFGTNDYVVGEGNLHAKFGNFIITGGFSPYRWNITFRTSANFLANVNVVRYMSSSVRLSVVCLSVTFVHPTQAIEIFGNVSMLFGTLAIRWYPGKILRRLSQGNPSVGELNTRGVAEYSDFLPIERYISETVQDRS